MTLPAWFLIALGAIVVAAVAIPIGVMAWRRKHPVPLTDKRIGGRMVGAAIVVGWIVVVWVTGSTLLQAVAIGTGEWPVPVLTAPYWPQIPPNQFIGIGDASYGPGDTIITSGGYTEANAVIPDLTAAARVWDIIAVAIQGAAIVVAAVIVIRLCRNLRAGRGLNGAGAMFGTLSVVALLGGFAWQIARQVGGSLAAHQIDLGGFDSFPDSGVAWPVAAGNINIDFWPILPFLAFGALAAAFRYAERLQKDSEGLV